VTLDFESLVLVALLATPHLALDFINPRSLSLRTLNRRPSLQSILLVINSVVLCIYTRIVQVAIIVTAPVTHSAKFLNVQEVSKTDWLPTHIRDTYIYLVCGSFEDPQVMIFLTISAILDT
jgi:hypothetical protein